MRKYALPLIAAAAFATALGVSAANAQNLNVATAGPMTGEYAAFGDQMRHGAEQAVKDINAKGGVLGKNLALSIGDDACDPKQAVAVANDFVSKGIIFVAGHFCSGSGTHRGRRRRRDGVRPPRPHSLSTWHTENDPSLRGAQSQQF